MANIRIVNLHKYKLKDNEMLIKIDRSTVVGNPYTMHDESERDFVCDKYEKYFNQQMSDYDFSTYIYNIVEILNNNIDVALGCWCYPKRCHGETIIKYIKKCLD